MLSVYLLRMEKEWICWLMSFVCCSFVKPSRSSSVSVLFVLIASLSDVAPLSSMMLPVYLMRIEKRGLLMNVICVLVFLCSQSRLSVVSVVFDFNASLIDVAPASPMLLTVDLVRMEKSGLLTDAMWVSFVCIYISNRVQRVLCLISMLHSMTLLLCLQCCWLLIW